MAGFYFGQKQDPFAGLKGMGQVQQLAQAGMTKWSPPPGVANAYGQGGGGGGGGDGKGGGDGQNGGVMRNGAQGLDERQQQVLNWLSATGFQPTKQIYQQMAQQVDTPEGPNRRMQTVNAWLDDPNQTVTTDLYRLLQQAAGPGLTDPNLNRNRR